MQSPFLARVLEPPRYGWTRDGKFYRPTARELVAEWAHRVNVFRDKKNWLPFSNWFWTLSLAPFAVVFLWKYHSLAICAIGFVYAMVGLGTHGTIWLHRYGTHRCYTFSNGFFRFIARNLTIKIVPDEIYVISHHVHHEYSEKAGDPYNVHGGGLYCFLADTNHQPIARDLTEHEYTKMCRLMNHTGVRINSYAQYQKWGSIAHPFTSSLHFFLNWCFWYAAFWAIGGHALATGMFGWTMMWAVGIRTFNYAGHGNGKDRRRAGVDFDENSWAVNQIWPGYVAGEWHSNHHLFPNSWRNGFLPWQLDLAWLWLRMYRFLGGIDTVRDHTREFYEKYYLPWARANGRLPAAPVERETVDG